MVKEVPHVLVLEDDPAMQRLLAKQLGAHGFEVTVAANGLDGLVRLESLLPDAIVCDVNMPQLDGFGFIEAMRANERTRHIPFLFLTASSDEKDHQRALQIGAGAYLTKPFNLRELVSKLHRLCKAPAH